MGEEKAAKWLGMWDPSEYLPNVRMPMLWVTGTNDFAYPMDSLQKSYMASHFGYTLCVRVRMKHAHGGPGENPEEIWAMADAVLKEGAPLARIPGRGRSGDDAWVVFESDRPIVKAELNYTTGRGKWQERRWETMPARLDAEAGVAVGVLPEGTSVYYFNLIDEQGLVVSSEHTEVPLR
jgi:hypothetical protein